tara:strand:- start:1861 stop:2211 length:351 start_codon:yes stop_codon:yes gene_type:complete
MIYNIKPCPKPRMTQSDRWKKRPPVLRYWAFCDEVRLMGLVLPESGSSVIFTMPMPKSWPKKKRASMLGEYHQQKPDLDNLFKALGDAVYKDDSKICSVTMSKVWGESGSIEINKA